MTQKARWLPGSQRAFCYAEVLPSALNFYFNRAVCLPAIIPNTIAGPMVDPGPG